MEEGILYHPSTEVEGGGCDVLLSRAESYGEDSVGESREINFSSSDGGRVG